MSRLKSTKTDKKPTVKKPVVKLVKKTTAKKVTVKTDKIIVNPVEETVELAAVKPTGKLLAHFNLKGESEKGVSVPEDLAKVQVNPRLIVQAVRVYRMNLRQGTQSTKTRGEVTGSTRKIYRQKGTGRARHGDIKAPIFVGGGITFGPRPREFELKLPKKMKRLVFKGLLKEKAQKGEVAVVSGFDKAVGKTNEIVKLLKQLNYLGKNLLVVLDADMDLAWRAMRNIENINLRHADSVSGLDLLNCDQVIIAKECLGKLNVSSV